MKYNKAFLAGSALLLSAVLPVQAIALPMLVDFQVDVNGTTVGSTIDGSDFDGFDEASGLGTIEVTVATPGAHAVKAYVDHGFGDVEFDEHGQAAGSPAPGQSWEVDDPWLGDLFDKLCPFDCGGALDNAVYAGPDRFDVSMALGWDFFLDINEQAIIAFTVTQTLPADGLYLVHEDTVGTAGAFEDVDTGVLYFSSLLTIESIDTDPGDGTDPPGDGTDPPGDGTDPPGDGTDPPGDGTDPPGDGSNDVPVPATLWLVGIAALVMRLVRRRSA